LLAARQPPPHSDTGKAIAERARRNETRGWPLRLTDPRIGKGFAIGRQRPARSSIRSIVALELREMIMRTNWRLALRIVMAFAGSAGCLAHAQTLGSDFATDYSVFSLGSVPSLPSNYGGLTFLDSDTVLIGGAANGAGGRLYTIDVTRGADNHITGFTGTAALFRGGSIGTYNDGGVVFGPGGVLFTAEWPVNKLGQTKPGSTVEDKIIDLATLGVASSHSAINFVPASFGGAGQVKLVSYSGGQWYSGSLTPDGTGTYDITGLTQVDVDASIAGIQNLQGGPEGFTYIASGNAAFANNSLLLSEYQAGIVSAYEVDASGNPIAGTRRVFLSGLSGAEGATIDPVTGDFLFSTFGGGSKVVVVSGFTVPIVPEPSTWALLLAGLALGGIPALRRRR
jgi:PEP-CTERM motif